MCISVVHILTSAFHLLDLTEPTRRKGTQGLETPLQALPLWSSPSKGRISHEGDAICQKVLFKCLLSRGQSWIEIPVPAKKARAWWN